MPKFPDFLNRTESESLTETLAALNTAENGDTAFILAAAINLYSESLRRKHGRILYGPRDVESLFTICNMLLNLPAEMVTSTPRPAKPTAVEQEVILKGMEEAIDEEPTNVRRH